MNWAALAVFVDSAVTIAVGWKLMHRADKEVAQAAQEVEAGMRRAIDAKLEELWPKKGA